MLRPLIVVKATALVLASLLTAQTLAEEPGIFTPASPAAPPLRHYQLQLVQAAPGKLDALHARLRDHQMALMSKHGVEAIGIFTPEGENPIRQVFVLVRFADYEKSLIGWQDFLVDPDWKKVFEESEKDGPIVEKAGRNHLRTVYYSPVFEVQKAEPARVFELRTYRCPSKAKRGYLNKRFRDHTMKLFEKHGMENLLYWVPEDGPEADQMLVYLLAHKSVAAAKESFANFRQDPEWLAVKAKSEEQAGGSLTEKENGVVSQFLVPTEYSPLQ